MHRLVACVVILGLLGPVRDARAWQEEGAASTAASPWATRSCALAWHDDPETATRTLLEDCTTDTAINVPGGWTFDGQGHTIWAIDPPGGRFLGGVIAVNDSSAVRQLTIDGTQLTAPCEPDGGRTALAGLLIDGAGSTITSVTLRNIRRALPTGVAPHSVQAQASCGDGLTVRGRNEPVFLDGNVIENVGDAGIFVDGGAVSIARSTIYRAAVFGIVAVRARVRITPENRITNGFVGIQLEDPGAVGRIAGSTIDGMTQAGIVVLSGAEATVANNALTDIDGLGISVERPGSQAIVEQNTVARAATGVAAFGAEVRITGNTVTGAHHGVVAREGASATLSQNTIERSSGIGVWITDPDTTATIEGNTIANTSSSGINVGHSASAVIEGNTIRGAINEGIIVEFEGQARIIDNQVINAEEVGISITHGSEVEVSGENLICGGKTGILIFLTDKKVTISGAVISVRGKSISQNADGQTTVTKSDATPEEAAARCANAGVMR